ncbi:MAG: PD-(D/E)XK nuclease family protein [bacterium]|nr:PD-(D/E)XK nuclease family protein [bacterium]
MNIPINKDRTTLLITPSNLQKEIIKQLSKENDLLNINYTTFEEIKKKLIFDYTDETILYLTNKYNYKIEVSKMYIDNLYYIYDKKYTHPLLVTLLNYKQELIDNNLLIYDSLYPLYLQDKDIIIYGFDKINAFQQQLILMLKNYNSNITIVAKEYKNFNNPTIYQFFDIEKEINFVAHQICRLIDQNVAISNIKLANVKEEYYFYLLKIFKFYNIPINININTPIIETPLGLDFLNYYFLTKDIDKTIAYITNKYDLKIEDNNHILNLIITTINNITTKNIDDIITYKFKNTNIAFKRKENAVELIDLKDNYISNEEHVFILNFNQTIIPTIYKDDEYLTDNLKEILGLETTTVKNVNETKILTNIIKSLNSPIITYVENSSTTKLYPSVLLKEFSTQPIVNFQAKDLISYSKRYDELTLGMKLDNFLKYQTTDEELEILYYNHQDTKYQTYNNNFTSINQQQFINYLNHRLILSYTSIDNYYHCHFRYYCENILKLKPYEETFATLIGNLYHHVLKEYYEDNFDFETSYQSFFTGKILTPKEEVLLNILKKELKFVIETLSHQEKYISLDKTLLEKEITVQLPSINNIDITFKGYVDKILYKKKNDTTIIAIVDYKTGKTNIDLTNLPYGLSLQLPIYIYLVKQLAQSKSLYIAGFYLQPILHQEIMHKEDGLYLKTKQDLLKLNGYSNSNTIILEQFDKSYANSRIIKGLRMIKDGGFSKMAKMLTNKQIEKIIEMTERHIKDATKEIISCQFDVNPKRIGEELLSCAYCPYQELCFVKEENVTTCPKIKNLDFIKGDDMNEANMD